MKIVAPKPFTYRGGNRAVLLLHGFTGNTGDVRKLGRYLQKRGYTCHAPLYEGHGIKPEWLIETSPEDWWQDAVAGYQFLQDEGFREIAVAGVSLGGVFALKIGAEFPVKGIISMSTPAQEKNTDDLYDRVVRYARDFKQFEGKDKDQIDQELLELEQTPMHSLENLKDIILDTRDKLSSIIAPTFILQGLLDDPLYVESAQIIHENIDTEEKH